MAHDLVVQGFSDAQWALFEALGQAVGRAYPQAQQRVMKTCVRFDDPKPFLYVSLPPRKAMGGLLLSVSLRDGTPNPRFFMLVPVSRTRFTAHIHLKDAAEIDAELLALIACGRR